jgi:hypothetical protein
MIKIELGFFDKKTEIVVESIEIDVPDDIVFNAVKHDEFTGNEFVLASANNKQIDYINSRPFDVTEEMKAFVVKEHPDLEKKFDLYLHEFIGRHGLGPEYD